MARAFALLAELRAQAAYQKGASRGIVVQDLAVGSADGPSVGLGDQIKCRTSVYAFEPAVNPFSIGRAIYSNKDARKIILGEGSLLGPAGAVVEERLSGMRKKGLRMLIVPPALSRPTDTTATLYAPGGAYAARRCPRCGGTAAPNAAACPACGAPLPPDSMTPR